MGCPGGCSGKVKSWLETATEHLAGRQEQHRGAQVHAVILSDQKEWSHEPPSQTSLRSWQWRQGHHLLEILAYLSLFKGGFFHFSV